MSPRTVRLRVSSVSCSTSALRPVGRSEEHTSELQSQSNLVCRLLLEKKKNKQIPSSADLPSHFCSRSPNCHVCVPLILCILSVMIVQRSSDSLLDCSSSLLVSSPLTP